MIRKMKIKTFLILSFVFILFLMSALGVASGFFTRKLANQTITFYEQPHTVQIEVAEVRRLMSDIGSLMRRAIVYQTPESDKYSQDEIQADVDEMFERIAIVKEQFTGDQQILLTADTTVSAWLAEIDKLNQMMDENKYEEAKKEFSTIYQQLEKEMNDTVLSISDFSQGVSQGFYEQAKRSKVISIWVISVTVGVTILLAMLICASILKGIAIPLKKVRDASEAMARGDLHYPIEYDSDNEFGQLVRSIKYTEETLAGYVENIDYVLGRISDNDLTVQLEMDYIGDFARIRQSLQQILAAMNYSMTQISQSSDQVAASALQASDSAQILSQGAAEQASSVEQLSASLTDIYGQVDSNADYTFQTHNLVDTVVSEMNHGNNQMQQMLKAMTEINHSSNQIAKIIKTIEDIAFQTNILALNAAVEAARAGTAGKGFAVVADEVRSLAAKSAEAAKSTTVMIQNSIQAVENGTRIADDTASTLGSVVSRAQDITQMVSKISQSSEEQSKHLSQINLVVSQIAHVIQSNSATCEESAAANEEMSGQAQVMNELVAKFHLSSIEP